MGPRSQGALCNNSSNLCLCRNHRWQRKCRHCSCRLGYKLTLTNTVKNDQTVTVAAIPPTPTTTTPYKTAKAMTR